jgi:hypothetical protein
VNTSPQERIEQWAERDAAVGLAAEAEQLRANLAERDATIEMLTQRNGQLADRVAQLRIDNEALRRRIAVSGEVSRLARRSYVEARSVAHRLIRR